MKVASYLPILAFVGLAGCATHLTNVATTTSRQATSEPPHRILLEPRTAVPHEMWGATSASVGKVSP